MIDAVIIGDPVKHPKRFARVRKDLDRLGIFNLFDSPAVYVDKSETQPGITRSAPACGCLRAHRKVWLDYLAKGNPDPIVVFEDDVMPFGGDQMAIDVTREVIRRLKGGVDHLYLLGWGTRSPMYSYTGTYAYAINPAGARYLLELMPHTCAQRAVDRTIGALVMYDTRYRTGPVGVIGKSGWFVPSYKKYEGGVFRANGMASSIALSSYLWQAHEQRTETAKAVRSGINLLVWMMQNYSSRIYN